MTDRKTPNVSPKTVNPSTIGEAMETNWQREGTFLYTLKHAGYRKGQEQFQNASTISIGGDNADEVADVVFAALTHPPRASEAEIDGLDDLKVFAEECLGAHEYGSLEYRLAYSYLADIKPSTICKDDQEQAVWQAIQDISFGNKTDDKMIVANLHKAGFAIVSRQSAPQQKAGEVGESLGRVKTSDGVAEGGHPNDEVSGCVNPIILDGDKWVRAWMQDYGQVYIKRRKL